MKAYRVHEDRSGAAKFGLGRFDTMSREGLYDPNLPFTQAYDLQFINKKVGLEKMNTAP